MSCDRIPSVMALKTDSIRTCDVVRDPHLSDIVGFSRGKIGFEDVFDFAREDLSVRIAGYASRRS